MPLILPRNPTAAETLARAKRLESQGRYAEASAAFLAASERYGELGDPNAAQIWRDVSRRYRTDATLFVDKAPKIAERLARLEPASGCYLGANVEREDGADRDPKRFDSTVGRDHATFFIYRSYGRPFPADLARQLRERGAGLQIAWEPKSLDETLDVRYLESFMRAAARSGIAVFLRFASEMNGGWSPYHGDPLRYREAFQRVAAVAHAVALNVAMVWCPSATPEIGLDAYYPGPEAVDWVGVNFYSVLFNDGDRQRGAAWRHPEDELAYVYSRYAGSHPIMVGEWAATHRSVVDDKPRPDFAIEKIRQLYAAVPRLYPRVKAVHWLSANTIRYAEGTRRLNDFTLLDDPEIAKAYQGATAEPFYLGQIGRYAATVPQVLRNGDRLGGKIVLSAYVRSYSSTSRTVVSVDGQNVLDERVEGPHRVPLSLDTEVHNVVLSVYDDAGRLVGKQIRRISVVP